MTLEKQYMKCLAHILIYHIYTFAFTDRTAGNKRGISPGQLWKCLGSDDFISSLTCLWEILVGLLTVRRPNTVYDVAL